MVKGMGLTHSGNKGKRFERKIANLLTDWAGLPFGRTPMSGAYVKEPGDIICLDSNACFPFSVECKHWEGWTLDNVFHINGNMPGWLAQMMEQTQNKSIATGQLYWPMLLFTRNRRPIYILIPRIIVLVGGRLDTTHIILKTESWGQFVVGEATDVLKGISFQKVLEYHAKLTAANSEIAQNQKNGHVVEAG